MPVEGGPTPQYEKAKVLHDHVSREDAVEMLLRTTGVEYAPEVIALGETDLRKKLKAKNSIVIVYIGPLFESAFQVIPASVEQIHTNLYNGEMRQTKMRDIGGKDAETLLAEIKEREDWVCSVHVEKSAILLIQSLSFKRRRMKTKEKSVQFVTLSVADMGFAEGATTAELFGTKDDEPPFSSGAATKLGLGLCKPDVALYWLLRDKYVEEEEGPNEDVWFGTEQIIDSGGLSNLFVVKDEGGGQQSLGTRWLQFRGPFGPKDRFVFRKL